MQALKKTVQLLHDTAFTRGIIERVYWYGFLLLLRMLHTNGIFQVSSVEVVVEVISAIDRIMIDEDRIGAVKEESVENVLIENCIDFLKKIIILKCFVNPLLYISSYWITHEFIIITITEKITVLPII